MRKTFIYVFAVGFLLSSCSQTEKTVVNPVSPSTKRDADSIVNTLEFGCRYRADVNDIIEVIGVFPVLDRVNKIADIVCRRVLEKKGKSLSNNISVVVNGVEIRGTVY